MRLALQAAIVFTAIGRTTSTLKASLLAKVKVAEARVAEAVPKKQKGATLNKDGINLSD